MDQALKEMFQYGALGIMVVGLAWFILWYIKRQDKLDTFRQESFDKALTKYSEILDQVVDKHERERSNLLSKVDAMYGNTVKVIERNSIAMTQLSETVKTALRYTSKGE